MTFGMRATRPEDARKTASMKRVLGIDVASASWADIGAAAVDFDEGRITAVVPAPIPWPNEPLTPIALARTIDWFAREYAVSAVGLDGPQGWRDPDTDVNLPGVGRRCEYLCRAQGKTGVYRQTYPATQVGWIEFSIELFRHLLAFPGVTLAGEGDTDTEGYLVLECFPTSAWRSSGLRPLPGKSKKPSLGGYRDSLREAYGLPEFDTSSHDDLQGVVAALCAVGATGGPVIPVPQGVAGRVIATGRVEGLIWDITPVGGAVPLPATSVAAVVSSPPRSLSPTASERSVYVTPAVLAQVNRVGASQMQIALRGIPGGSKQDKLRVRLTIEGDNYVLVLGDSHAAWRTHQDSGSLEPFDQLFALAADTPGYRLPVSHVEVLKSE